MEKQWIECTQCGWEGPPDQCTLPEIGLCCPLCGSALHLEETVFEWDA
jgi:hypothetical protein